jgi:hypothetical protein
MKPESNQKPLLDPAWIERDLSNRLTSRVDVLCWFPEAPNNCSILAREAARHD